MEMDYKKLPTVYQDEKIEDYRKFKFRLDDRVKFITKNIKPQSHVLDCGSFLGYISNEISKRGCSVVGIEANSLLVKEAQKKFPRIKFICGDAMNLRKYFNRREFNCVIADEIIEHLINPDLFLQNVQYVLKPRGKLILTTQNSNGIQFRIRMFLGRFRWDFDHFRLYSIPEIKEQVSKNNFKILRIKTIPVSKIGENQILRLCAYCFGKIFPSLAWTTGIVAQKKMQPNYEESKISYTKMLEKSTSKNHKRLWTYFQKILPKIEKLILIKKVKSKIKILSIGSGVGYELTFFWKQGYTNLYGIDINRYSLKTAKKNCPQAIFSNGDIYQIPYSNSSFDLILLIEVIEHLDYPVKALQEIKRVLKSNGVLFLTTPNRMGLMGLSNGPIKFFTNGYYYKSVLRILGKLTCGPEHPKEYFAFELARMLEKQQLKVLCFPKFCYIPLFPAGKYYLIAQKK